MQRIWVVQVDVLSCNKGIGRDQIQDDTEIPQKMAAREGTVQKEADRILHDCYYVTAQHMQFGWGYTEKLGKTHFEPHELRIVRHFVQTGRWVLFPQESG